MSWTCDKRGSGGAKWNCPVQRGQTEWLHHVIDGDWDLAPYLHGIYGERVDASRISLAEIDFFWNYVPGRSSFDATWACWNCEVMKRGLLWAPVSDAFLNPHVVERYPSAARCQHARGDPSWDTNCLRGPAFDHMDIGKGTFPGFFVRRFDNFWIDLERWRAPAHFTTGVPDHTWVEVMRVARLDISGPPMVDGLATCAVGQVWMWYAPGSGIWWNTGRSKFYDTPPVPIWRTESYQRGHTPPCTSARAEGYDSIQMVSFGTAFSFELLDCRGADLATASRKWEAACPPAHVELRAGVPERRYAPALGALPAGETRRCVCDDALDHISCAPGN